MDSRTRKSYLKKARTLMHMLEGHYGALGHDADYGVIFREGQDAINALALPVVARQQARRINRAADAVRVALEAYAGTVDDAEVEEVMQDPAVTNLSRWHVEGEQWGIGRGLPTGDVQ